MRVIAGLAKGIKLSPPPKELAIRPTLDRVREALFSILMPRLEGARFLDLFAGTGANGIEALSRGAAGCTFVDGDARALKLVRENVARAKLERGAECLKLEVPRDLGRLKGPFDVIFADPPYAFAEHEALLKGLQQFALLSPEGVFVLEHGRKTDLPEQVEELVRTRQAKYGDTMLSFYGWGKQGGC